MRSRSRLLLVGAAAVAVAGVAAAAYRRRALPPEARGAPMRPLRGFVSHRFDPLVVRLGLAGGPHSPWGLVEHVGRTSGHVYRTPVAPRPIEGGYEIPLAYGADAEWVRNVLVAGQARLQVHDTIVEADEPEIVGGADARSLGPVMRVAAERMGYRYLRLRTVATMPGAFSHLDGHAVAETHGEPVPVVAEPVATPIAADVAAADPASTTG